MKPYQPSQIVPAGGALILLVIVLVGGAVVGALFSLIANLFTLILIFPLLMGLIGAALVAFALRSGKIRNPLVGLVAGVLIGLVIYGSMWAVDYLQFRNNATLYGASGAPDFTGFVMLKDQAGASVVRLGSGSNALNLGPAFSWVYWGLELLIIVWLAAQAGRNRAREPFCEACERWYEKPELIGTLGASRTKEIMGLVEGNQFQKLGEELQSNPALPNVGVFLATCGADCADGDGYLKISRQTRSSRGKAVANDLEAGLISPLQLQNLRQGIEARKALYGFESPVSSK